jgi:outer membrane lipoprotein carrier protein
MRGKVESRRRNVETLPLPRAALLTALCLGCGDNQSSSDTKPSGTTLTVQGSAIPGSASARPPTSGAAPTAPASSGSAAPSATASASSEGGAKLTASAPTTAPTGTAAPAPTGTAAAPSVTPPEPAPTDPVFELPPPAAGSADEVAANIDATFKDATRFTAKFLQKHKQKVAGVEREMKGVVFIERPNRISFRYDPPNKNRIVSDGSTLKVYIAEDEQMFEQPVKNTEYPGAFGFIMGSGIRPSFEFSFNEKAKFDLGHVLIGKPRTPNPQYEQVLFYVHKEKLAKKDPGVVTGVLIIDAQGNRNRFELYDASIPEKIDASEFAFTPPPGTNVTK